MNDTINSKIKAITRAHAKALIEPAIGMISTMVLSFYFGRYLLTPIFPEHGELIAFGAVTVVGLGGAVVGYVYDTHFWVPGK